jgi:hypothetical protein
LQCAFEDLGQPLYAFDDYRGPGRETFRHGRRDTDGGP